MSCWVTLGIAPTADVLVIKRAYAAKLKVTRPDDDAAAYQRLRDDYDSALRESKRLQAREPVGDVLPISVQSLTDANDGAQLVCVPKQEPLASICDDEQAIEEYSELPDSRQLVHGILAKWSRQNDSDLIHYWPELERLLLRTPLSDTRQYSLELAGMVVNHPDLPARFVQKLALYFKWREDRLLERQLGLYQANLLRDRLQRLEFQIKSEEVHVAVRADAEAARQRAEAEQRARVIEQHSQLSDFARLLSTVPPPRQQFYAFLAGPKLMHSWDRLTVEQCALLNFAPDVHEYGSTVLHLGARWRGLLVLVIMFVCGIMNTATGVESHYLAGAALVVLLLVHAKYPIGVWLEHVRSRWFSNSSGDAQGMRIDARQPHELGRAIMFSFVGAVIAVAGVSVDAGQGADWLLVMVVFGCLGFAWLDNPIESGPTMKIRPLIFCFCLFSVYAIGLPHWLLMLAIGTAWHCMAYSTRLPPWGKIVGGLWIVVLPMLLFQEEAISIPLVSFVAPWVLYELTTRESPEYVYGCLGVCIVALQFSNLQLSVIGTGVVGLMWLAVSAGMREYASRLVIETAALPNR